MSLKTQKAYDLWSEQYDSNENKTRDLEGIALRESLAEIPFKTCLEIGCGTGKNTEFLVSKADSVAAVDLSSEMLEKAKKKVTSSKVDFKQADIMQSWDFVDRSDYDLVTFSLVLEHIENLRNVFEKVSKVLAVGGHVYLGELHPFKQYSGSKARFDTADGVQVVPCFNHHISDFVVAAKASGLEMLELKEYFDNEGRSVLPRILVMVFKKA